MIWKGLTNAEVLYAEEVDFVKYYPQIAITKIKKFSTFTDTRLSQYEVSSYMKFHTMNLVMIPALHLIEASEFTVDVNKSVTKLKVTK